MACLPTRSSVHPQEKHVKQRRRRRSRGEKKAVKLKQCKKEKQRRLQAESGGDNIFLAFFFFKVRLDRTYFAEN